jgi:hypothetical protein
MSRCRPRLGFLLAALVFAGIATAAGCSGPPDDTTEEEAPIETPTLPPTTLLEVPFIDATDMEFCDVGRLVAPAIQTFTDEGADFGDPGVVQDTYVGAFVAFDALEQVATREIIDDVGLLTRTLSEAVYAASDAGWDITKVTDDAAAGVSAEEVDEALNHLRQYMIERCRIDIYDIEPAVTTSAFEPPTQRLLRVLAYTFPSLTQESILCLAARLPIDWDPDDPEDDDTALLRAMARCGIDPDAPSTPTTSTSTTVADED